ncbi:MAG TPA: hypothetical protein VGL35_11345 [Rhizomicrobium sp.]|jgi:hypothetical protein
MSYDAKKIILAGSLAGMAMVIGTASDAAQPSLSPGIAGEGARGLDVAEEM